MAVVFVALLAVQFAAAQMDSSRVERQLDRLKTELSLTADQSAKIRTILYTSAAERQKMRSESGGDPAAMRQSMMQQMADTDKKVNAVLTEEQQKKYEKIRAERRQMMQERRPPN